MSAHTLEYHWNGQHLDNISLLHDTMNDYEGNEDSVRAVKERDHTYGCSMVGCEVTGDNMPQLSGTADRLMLANQTLSWTLWNKAALSCSIELCHMIIQIHSGTLLGCLTTNCHSCWEWKPSLRFCCRDDKLSWKLTATCTAKHELNITEQ